MSKSTMRPLRFKLLRPDATLPSRAHQTDAGLDLVSLEEVWLGSRLQHQFCLGLAVELPEGTVGLVQGRSGLAFKHSLTTIGNVIDSGYRGELHVVLINLGDEAVS